MLPRCNANPGLPEAFQLLGDYIQKVSQLVTLYAFPVDKDGRCAPDPDVPAILNIFKYKGPVAGGFAVTIVSGHVQPQPFSDGQNLGIIESVVIF